MNEFNNKQKIKDLLLMVSFEIITKEFTRDEILIFNDMINKTTLNAKIESEKIIKKFEEEMEEKFGIDWRKNSDICEDKINE